MCYYSKTLRSDSFRSAKAEGEDMTLKADGQGHHYATGDSDGKIVCLLPGTQMHIAKLELNPEFAFRVRDEMIRVGLDLHDFLNKPLSAQFTEEHRGGHSADRIWITRNGRNVYGMHIIFLKAGTKFYTGEKRVPLETKLGMDDPSIVLDHREETPTVTRTLARVDGLCSIIR